MGSDQAYIESLLYYSARQANILPLTSVCNVRCVFCSHHQNPPQVQSYRIPHLSIDTVRTALSFMDENKPVVIGESVSKIMEGEPLTHPQCLDILAEIRRTMPHTPVQLTTNGTLIDEKVAEKLKALAPLAVNLSLNSASCSMRAKLMHDRRAEKAVAAAKLLQQYGVPYHGSIVAMPHITGWDDLTASVLYLEQCGAQTVRVFLPGFTKLAPKELQFAKDTWQKLHAHIDSLRKPGGVPITCEPQMPTDLSAEVLGVIKGSPADKAGIKMGDVLIKAGGISVKSRVDAFEKVRAAADPAVELRRGGEKLTLKIDKPAGQTSGLVMAYDIHPEVISDIEAAVRRRRAKRALLLCSRLAYPVLRAALERLYQGECELRLHPVENRFFGGNIMAAGLLTAADFAACRQTASLREYDVVLLPAAPFDMHGRDLTGQSYLDLQQQWGKPVELI